MRKKDIMYPNLGLRTKHFNFLEKSESYTDGKFSKQDGCNQNTEYQMQYKKEVTDVSDLGQFGLTDGSFWNLRAMALQRSENSSKLIYRPKR